MPIEFIDFPEDNYIIKVIGVGGGGSNAVENMHEKGIVGVSFIVCNTDVQALDKCTVPTKVRLGPNLTKGLGAGSRPEVGRNATIESLEEIQRHVGAETKMAFVTAGMGGGTGTGGAPVIAKALKEMGILTVGIVTSPFEIEGATRIRNGQGGIEELKNNVDTLIIISNNKLLEMYPNLSLRQAFSQADDVLATAARGIAEIITKTGEVNVDFEDVNTVMRDSGVALMGSATGEGDERAQKAIKEALSSPLINDNDISGAQHVLLNITSSSDKPVGMKEFGVITNHVKEMTGEETNIIWGTCYDDDLDDQLCITVIITGFNNNEESVAEVEPEQQYVAPPQPVVEYTPPKPKPKPVVPLDNHPNNSSEEIELRKREEPSNQVVFDGFDNFNPPNNNTPSGTQPHGRDEGIEDEDDSMRELKKRIERKTQQTRARLNKLSEDLLRELEGKPSYKRDDSYSDEDDVMHSDEQYSSDYSVDKDDLDDSENSHLHKGVD